MGSEENYRKALAEERLTEADLRKKYEPDVRKQLTVMQLVEREVQTKTSVTDAEVKTYYIAHRDSIAKKPEQLKLAAIVIGFEADSSQMKRLRSRADSLRAAIVKGKPFEEVARAASDDPSGQSGGDLGTFGRGDMVREFEDVAFDLNRWKSASWCGRFGLHIQALEHLSATDSTAERVHARHARCKMRLGPPEENGLQARHRDPGFDPGGADFADGEAALDGRRLLRLGGFMGDSRDGAPPTSGAGHRCGNQFRCRSKARWLLHRELLGRIRSRARSEIRKT
jgi:hypothetical protein